MRRNNLHPRRSGATLVEIMVVIAIITTLSGLSFVSYTSAKRFGDKIESQTADAITKVNRNLMKLPGAQLVEPPPASSAPQPRPDRIPGEYFVGFASSVKDPNAEAQRLAQLVGGSVRHVYVNGLFGCGLRCPDAKAGLLALDPAVRKVEQARYIYAAAVPTNIKRVHSNGIRGTGAVGFRVGGASATPPRWDQTAVNTTYGLPTSIYRFSFGASAPPAVPITSRVFIPAANTGPNVTVAILDTGIDSTHPDLNVVANVDFTGGNNPMDTDGHGTHVAGVVGAKNQSTGVGVVGIHPGVPLLNLKVMDNIARNLATGTVQTITIANSGFPSFTFVNALRIRSGINHLLSTGDQVSIGNVTAAPVFSSVNAPQLSNVVAFTTYTITKIDSDEFWLQNTNNTAGGPAAPSNPTTGTWTEVLTTSKNDRAGSNLNVYAALDFVIKNASSINVCLMPFETSVDTDMNTLVDQAGNLGVLMVAAAGNGAVNAKTNVSPASASQSIVVGAITDSDGLPGRFGVAGDDTAAAYSNTNVDVHAPGGTDVAGFYQIRSTIPIAGAQQFLAFPFDPYSLQINGNPIVANRAFGTSFAAAHVAGMLALMLDSNSEIGFVLGGRGVPTYRLQMTNKTSALASLLNATRRTESIQMINPRTGSMWVRTVSAGPFFNFTTVTPFTVDFLPNDTTGGIPIANFYVNPGDPRSPGASGLTAFPGHSQ